MASQVEVIVRGLAVRDGKVLVCRNDRDGYCYLPGGHVEFGESARDAMKREFAEEAGASLDVGEFAIATEEVFECRGKRHHELNLVFHVEVPFDIEVTSREGGISFAWIDVAALHSFDLRPPTILAWLASGASEQVRWASGISGKVT